MKPLCLVVLSLVLACGLLSCGKKIATQEQSTDDEFNKWGVSLTPPKGWNGGEDNADAAIREQMPKQIIGSAAWRSPEAGGGFVFLTVTRWRESPNLNQMLAEMPDILERHTAAANPLTVHQLEIVTEDGMTRLVVDTSARGRGRDTTHYVVRGGDEIQLTCRANDEARYDDYKSVFDAVIGSLKVTEYEGRQGGSP